MPDGTIASNTLDMYDAVYGVAAAGTTAAATHAVSNHYISKHFDPTDS
ncbi:MAG TPA: hypothetical protein VK674_02850 [Candidatus Limnocylindria bacterium]|nr:hypothetical protein [Candidatus Limnocylindria bacterium]